MSLAHSTSVKLTLGRMRSFDPGLVATVHLPLTIATETRRTYSKRVSSRQYTSDCFSTSRYRVEVHDRTIGLTVVSRELAYGCVAEDVPMGLRFSPIAVVGRANWTHENDQCGGHVDGHLEFALVEIPAS